jgi:uncharacterized protein (TIGR02466 family)
MTDFSIIPLFPLALYKSKFRELTREELDIIAEYPVAKQPLGNNSSQTPYFLDAAGLEQLKSDIKQHIDTYAKDVMQAPYDVYLTNSWKNLTSPNEQHIMHNHTNSVISGVLYIKSSYIQPTISFHRIQPPYVLSWEPTEFNMFNSMEWTVPVEDLDIIIFPSTLFHYVKPNTSNKDRISIAFNTFARGNIKTGSTGADLILN